MCCWQLSGWIFDCSSCQSQVHLSWLICCTGCSFKTQSTHFYQCRCWRHSRSLCYSALYIQKLVLMYVWDRYFVGHPAFQTFSCRFEVELKNLEVVLLLYYSTTFCNSSVSLAVNDATTPVLVGQSFLSFYSSKHTSCHSSIFVLFGYKTFLQRTVFFSVWAPGYYSQCWHILVLEQAALFICSHPLRRKKFCDGVSGLSGFYSPKIKLTQLKLYGLCFKGPCGKTNKLKLDVTSKKSGHLS